MDFNFTYTIWIVLLPLFVFLLLGLTTFKMKPIIAGTIGTVGLGIVTAMSYYTAFMYFFRVGETDGVYQKIIAFNKLWVTFTDKLHIDLGVLLDPISVMMLVVVSTVSFMVHIYSLGYMKGDPGFNRFYAFLSLFTFSMMGLVVATNIFQMYMFWELVGVSSFLLIGYYYEKPSAVAASKKAFIVTRFADLGFLIGILLLSYLTGTFDFGLLTDPNGAAVTQGGSIAFLGLSTMTWALLLIFMGGAGKSAMFPFHIWLPDAMEGPTPVSALIHAATMVVAGVYLVARLFVVFSIGAPDALEVIAFVGGFTSLFAAIIACTQMDIKRVLAFSTLSQLGYMMLALGVSGYGGEHSVGFMASMFHLFTHAMFKALLFLGAGSIIHAVHSNYMSDMGGLRKYMPITHWTFLIATLAISGIWPFAGFFSKDEILVAAYEHSKLYFFLEWFVAGLTAFYMFRLYFGIFWGEDRKYEHAPHESPIAMTFPLMFLAFMSIILGAFFFYVIPFSELVTPDGEGFETHTHWNIALASVAIAVAGIALAFVMYKKASDKPAKVANSFGAFYKWTKDKFYFDELYMFVTHKIIFDRIAAPIKWFDRHIVDGAMDGMAYITNAVSSGIKGTQSGKTHDYAFAFIAGVVVLVLVFVYFRG